MAACRLRGGQGKRNDLADAIEALKDGGIKRVAQEHPVAFVKFHRGLHALEAALVSPPKDASFVPRPWQSRVLRLLEQPPDDRTILWVYDAVGGMGKSRLARFLCSEKGAITLEGRVTDMAFMYTDEPIVIFDISRSQAEFTDHLYSFAEKLKNGVVVSTKYESRCKHFSPPHVLFFSNGKPADGKWSADRLKLIDLSNPHIDVPGMQLAL